MKLGGGGGGLYSRPQPSTGGIAVGQPVYSETV